MARAMFASLRAVVRVARGEDLTDELRGLRPMWRLDGALAVHAAAQEIRLATQRGDVAAARASYDHVVTVIGDIWHPWFDGRVRIAALVLETIAAAIPKVPAGDRAPLLEARRPAPRRGSHGPRAVRRPEQVVGTRGPRLAGPPRRRADPGALAGRRRRRPDAGGPGVGLARGGGRSSCSSVTSTSWRVPRWCWPRCCVPRARPPRPARSVTRPARPPGGSARPRWSSSSGRSARRPPATRRAPTCSRPRETEILQHVAAGRTNGEIGKQLFISTKTVSVHVSNILGKLGASGRTEAAAIARRRGLVD